MLVALSSAMFLEAQTGSVSGRMQDLSFVATQLPKLDAHFFAQLSPATFQGAVNTLQANIASLTDAQFYVGLAQLVAMAGDAHTNLYLSTAPGFQQLPLHLRWLDDGVFVTSAGPEYMRALGTRLVGIGDYSIDEVMRRLATIIPHDNDQWLHYVAQTYLTQQQALQGLGIVPEGSPSSLTFQSLDGTEFTLSMDASNEARVSLLSADTGAIPDYLQNTSQNYWFAYSAPNRLLYFKYNVCANDPSNPFVSFAATIVSALDKNPIDTLVFDFRGNTGGDSTIINPLVSSLIQRLTRLTANPKFALYIAIDKGTFSSGMDDAEEFKQPGLASIARVVGEPTGGRPQHYGNVTSFSLPSSRVGGQYSTQFFAQPSYLPPGPSLAPDITVPIRSTDYFARFDPVMAAILARSHGSPPPASGDLTTVNAASFRLEQGIAPGSLAAAFGMFSTTPDQVLVSGTDARILTANPGQVNFVVPESVMPGPAVISVRAAANEIAAGTATITAAGPGIFVLQPADAVQPGAVENQDYSVNGASQPAAANTVVQIFATGYGGDALPVEVFFFDTPAEVLYSGLVGPGLWQIDARVPSGLSGRTPVFLIAGGLASNGVTVAIQ